MLLLPLDKNVSFNRTKVLVLLHHVSILHHLSQKIIHSIFLRASIAIRIVVLSTCSIRFKSLQPWTSTILCIISSNTQSEDQVKFLTSKLRTVTCKSSSNIEMVLLNSNLHQLPSNHQVTHFSSKLHLRYRETHNLLQYVHNLRQYSSKYNIRRWQLTEINRITMLPQVPI